MDPRFVFQVRRHAADLEGYALHYLYTPRGGGCWKDWLPSSGSRVWSRPTRTNLVCVMGCCLHALMGRAEDPAPAGFCRLPGKWPEDRAAPARNAGPARFAGAV